MPWSSGGHIPPGEDGKLGGKYTTPTFKYDNAKYTRAHTHNTGFAVAVIAAAQPSGVRPKRVLLACLQAAFCFHSGGGGGSHSNKPQKNTETQQNTQRERYKAYNRHHTTHTQPMQTCARTHTYTIIYIHTDTQTTYPHRCTCTHRHR